MHARIKGNKINAYSENKFRKKKGYLYVETDIDIDEFCYYENGEIIRKTDEEIDVIYSEREQASRFNQKIRILSYIDKDYLLEQGTTLQVTKYREILSDFIDISNITQEQFDLIEIKVLKFELGKTETLTGSETLEDLKQLYNDFFVTI